MLFCLTRSKEKQFFEHVPKIIVELFPYFLRSKEQLPAVYEGSLLFVVHEKVKGEGALFLAFFHEFFDAPEISFVAFAVENGLIVLN